MEKEIVSNFVTLGEEPRLFQERGLDAEIAVIVQPVLHSMDFRLVRIHRSSMNGMTIQIMVERADGSLAIEDCEQISRALSPLLDGFDGIQGHYHLEISSPGIDRPLVRKSDFVKWIGSLVRGEVSTSSSGIKRFRGTIFEVADDRFSIETDQELPDTDKIQTIVFSNLVEARLVLTDNLIKKVLREDKRALKEKQRKGDESKVTDSQL